MPAIRRIAGMTTLRSPIHFGVAGFEYRKMAGRTEFIPVSVEGRDSCDRPILKMLDRGSAGRLLPLSVADGVAVLPEDVIEIVDGLKLAYTPLV
jgi:molybdopterin molybdotransferase